MIRKYTGIQRVILGFTLLMFFLLLAGNPFRRMTPKHTWWSINAVDNEWADETAGRTSIQQLIRSLEAPPPLDSDDLAGLLAIEFIELTLPEQQNCNHLTKESSLESDDESVSWKWAVHPERKRLMRNLGRVDMEMEQIQQRSGASE